MPNPETCELTGTVLNASGTGLAAAGTRVTAEQVLLPGYALQAVSVTFYVDAEGKLKTAVEGGESARLPRGARVTFQGEVWGFTKDTEVLIPDLAEYEFRLLVPVGDAPDNAASEEALLAEIERATAREDEIEALIGGAALALFTQTVTGDTTLDIGDSLRALILVDSSAGDVTVTLRPAADVPGREITFKKISDDNLAIIDGDGSETIDGQLVFNLEMMNQTVKVMPVGSDWYIV